MLRSGKMWRASWIPLAAAAARPLVKLARQQPEPIPDHHLVRHTPSIPRAHPGPSPTPRAYLFAGPKDTDRVASLGTPSVAWPALGNVPKGSSTVAHLTVDVVDTQIVHHLGRVATLREQPSAVNLFVPG